MMRLKKWQLITLITLAILALAMLGIGFAVVVAPLSRPVSAVVVYTPNTPPSTLTNTPLPTDTPLPTSTPTPGDTPTPENSPTITITPSKTPTPTKTGIPTRTPRPTVTFTPTASREELEAKLAELQAELKYINEVESEKLHSSMSDLERLDKQLETNPYIYANAAWQTQVAAVFVTWKQIRANVQTITPPPSMKEYHRLYTKALDSLAMAADHLTLGFSKADQEEVDRGWEDYREAKRLLDEAWKTV